MASDRTWSTAEVATAHARGGLRALRKDETEQQIERRLFVLGLEAEPSVAVRRDPQLLSRLSRALRAERRAARSGLRYDPVRHLVLARLMKRYPAGCQRHSSSGRKE